MTNDFKPRSTAVGSVDNQPVADRDPWQVPVADLMSAADSFEYVGFWQRVFAGVIDAVVTSVVMLPPMYLLFGPIVFGSDPDYRPGVLYTIVSFAGPAAIVFIFWIKKAATPGKMLINSKIIDATTGAKPSISQWLIRYLGYLVATLPLGLGLMAVGWDDRKQGWHDKMAKTLVVKK